MENTTFTPPQKKHIIITGHYGSGKTHVAVNLALFLKKSGAAVTLIDLDTVNPYFRAADSQKLLTESGVRCILPDYANTNVDIPSIPAEIHSVFSSQAQPDKLPEYAIFDVGGDNGAIALGAFSHRLTHDGYEMLYVINQFRPLTKTPEDAIEIMQEIEDCSRLRHTAVVNNSNIGDLTTSKTIYASHGYAEAVCALTGLPLAFTSHMPLKDTDRHETLSGNDSPLFLLQYVTKRLF